MYLFRTDSCHSIGRWRPGWPERPPRSDIRKEPLMVRAFLPKAVLLVVTLLFTVPTQAAESRSAGSMESGAQGIFAQIWDFLTGGWARIGCGIDPDGRCVPQPNPTIVSGCDI